MKATLRKNGSYMIAIKEIHYFGHIQVEFEIVNILIDSNAANDKDTHITKDQIIKKIKYNLREYGNAYYDYWTEKFLEYSPDELYECIIERARPIGKKLFPDLYKGKLAAYIP